MKITTETTIHALLEAYPDLKGWLVAYSDDFKKLENPVLYNTVARVADLKAAAAMAGVDTEKFVDDVRAEVALRTIIAEETSGAAPQLDDDERARRQEILKGLILELHDGASTSDVKARFDELVRDIDATEVALMEQSLIAEGMPVSEVQRLCDVHVTVFKDALDDRSADLPDIPSDHALDAYRRENQVASEIVAETRRALGEGDLAEISAGLERLAQIEVHYTRKENQLFPVLEDHGVEGPTKVMWALDDDIRGRIKTARVQADAGDLAGLRPGLEELLTMVDDMVYKEEKILFPTALQVITAEEWARIAAGDPEIGYAWVEGPAGDAARAAAALAPAAGAGAGEMLLPLVTGALTLAQLNLMLTSLPFDVSYVDENDRVRFYSEGERVFPRSPGAIGRDVHNCHPPASVHKVVEILNAFKAGEKDEAEFWIEMGPRFIHIRYFAMRDADGGYRGCLEVVQDATHVRSLEGQRRLVNW